MKKAQRYLLVAAIFMAMLFLTGCSKNDTNVPIGINGFVIDDIFVYPMAGLMWLIAQLIPNYGIVIIIATLVVRTLAWPIYGKTNDMSLKMQLVAPEAEKIKQKYQGKDDPQSQQRMQMETLQLYKKYGIGLGGCLMPLIQLPIFIGFYRTISRMPASLAYEGHWLNVFKTTKIFGVDLLQTTAGGGMQKTAIIILAVLVGLTQILSIFISQRRQKKMKQEQQSNIPSYRRPDPSVTKSTELTMNIMLYGMAGMMVLFVIQSPAGLGLYWLVGNIYSTLQSYIGHKTSQKRLEVLKKRY
jgi:YidC/Oxa1 family membrane protein insertase